MSNDMVALLVQQLKASGQLPAILEHPSVQEVLAQSQPVQKFSLTDLSEDEYVFMVAYRSFLATEYGNPYVGMASKFARYLQSEVDKARS